MPVNPPTGEYRGVFRDDLEARAAYSEAAGIGRAIPRAVAVPSSAHDVEVLVRWARSESVPLVPRSVVTGEGFSVSLGRAQRA